MFHKGCGMSMFSGCFTLDSAHRRCCYTPSPFTDYTTLRLWRPTTWYTTGIKGINSIHNRSLCHNAGDGL